MTFRIQILPCTARVFCVAVLCFSANGMSQLSAVEDKEAPKLSFEDDVLPILSAKCVSCHGANEPKAGLNLSAYTSLVRGGKSGPSVRRAAAESSLLWERIAADEMPAKGEPLSPEEKSVIRLWINQGALGDEANQQFEDGLAKTTIGEEARNFWSFQTPLRPTLPTVQNRELVRTPIDVFILAKLETVGLDLAAEADRVTLIRRVSFDLTGLPPTPEEVEQFLSDDRPGAYERLVERLLASPRYGERWGRHWLDLAGYAESAGILFEDRQLPLAYRYRDYVIRAFNTDKPYDRFLQEQIAGDELVDYWTHFENDDELPEEVIEALTATGYLRCAADASRPDFSTIKNADAQYFYPTLNDTLKIVASSTLGLTVQCARCHDHMYDPIPQEDFYRLQAVFMGAYRPTNWIPQMERRRTTLSKSQLEAATKRNAEIDANVQQLNEKIVELQGEYKQRLFDQRIAALPEQIRDDVRQAIQTAAEQRTEIQKYLVVKFQASLQPDDATLVNLLPAECPEFKTAKTELEAKIAAERSRWYYYDEIRALYDLPGEVATPLLRRGDALTPSYHVSPGTLSVLEQTVAFHWEKPPAEAKTSGRRLAFARWLTDPHHPLTPRVMANRIWFNHFGQGIVATPDDFGSAGSRPSHPELLDWLAHEFVESGWSLKHMHRQIMLSATYRQRSVVDENRLAVGGQVDPNNRLLWHQPMRRLEAEPIRDAVLAVSGLLKPQMFGTPIPVSRDGEGQVITSGNADSFRRSIYLQVLRLTPLTMLESFDQPVMETNCLVRSRSIVSTQALNVLNSEAMVAAAEAFADRVLREDARQPETRAVWLAFSRSPSADERALLERFVERQTQAHLVDLQNRDSAAGDHQAAARRLAITDLCHMLLSSNEFIYID